MITSKDFAGHQFDSKKELHYALVNHLALVKSVKKGAVKFTDDLNFGAYSANESGVVTKANTYEGEVNAHEIQRKVVMNTTGLLDSHGDVHLPGIWKRTLSHSDKKLHLQEHVRSFKSVISDDAHAFVKTMTWEELGEKYQGSTEALIFDSLIKESRNKEMFDQYKQGWVNNHSVGMGYVDFVVCIDSDEKWAREYKDNFEEFKGYIVNPEDLGVEGYFWAIKEAKLYEGSAVLMGSNWVTPTLDNNMKFAPAPSEDSLKCTQNKSITFF